MLIGVTLVGRILIGLKLRPVSSAMGFETLRRRRLLPTGTIATVAGCEGYGCEPVFALAYVRHVDDNGTDLKLTYTSPLFEQALLDAGVDEDARERSWSR